MIDSLEGNMNEFFNVTNDLFEPDFDNATYGDVTESLEFTLEGDGDLGEVMEQKLADVMEYAESIGLKVRW